MKTILKTSFALSACVGLIFSMSSCEDAGTDPTGSGNAKQALNPVEGMVSCDSEIHPEMLVAFCPLDCGNGVWGNFWMVEQEEDPMWTWQTQTTVDDEARETNVLIEEEPPGPRMFLPLEVCDHVNMEFQEAGGYRITYEPIPDRPTREVCEGSPQSYTAIRIYSIEPVWGMNPDMGWE